MPDAACKDSGKYCQSWASMGYCDTSVVIRGLCSKSCGKCSTTPAPCYRCDDIDSSGPTTRPRIEVASSTGFTSASTTTGPATERHTRTNTRSSSTTLTTSATNGLTPSASKPVAADTPSLSHLLCQDNLPGTVCSNWASRKKCGSPSVLNVSMSFYCIFCECRQVNMWATAEFVHHMVYSHICFHSGSSVVPSNLSVVLVSQWL